MKIKIEAKNRDVIEAALKAVNGTASRHTYGSFVDVENAMRYADVQMDRLGIPRGYRKGAKYIEQSGDTLPKAYGYEAKTTTITIERGSSAWYLVEVKESGLYPRSKPLMRLTMTAEQDGIAVAQLRKKYVVARKEEA